MRAPARSGAGLRVSTAAFAGRTEEIRRVREVLHGTLKGCPAADEILLCASGALCELKLRHAGRGT